MTFSSIREQYEKYPYPPVGRFALPLRDQGVDLRYETGARLAFGHDENHRNKRILIVGCGTLEPLIVAQNHPDAAEIIALDCSSKSLSILRSRLALARTRNWVLPFRKKALPPLVTIEGDLAAWNEHGQGGSFDYILATNVLHHLKDPSAALRHLASQLHPGGLLRLVTYPKASRYWMRQTSKWLQLNGLSGRESPSESWQAIRTLPLDHPVRTTFEIHPEVHTATGMIDAFYNACENPLSPLEWRTAAFQAGLVLVGETQEEGSRSNFLDEVIPGLRGFDSWIKLEILDLFHEVCANPVLWFCKRPVSSDANGPVLAPDESEPETRSTQGQMPSRIRWELGQNLRKAERLLAGSGVTVSELIQGLRRVTGSRASGDRILPGLALSDYDPTELMTAHKPVREMTLEEAKRQIRQGPYSNWIEIYADPRT